MPFLRAERELGLQSDRVTGNKPQSPFLRKRRETKNTLHPRKRFAEACPASGREREVGKSRARGFRVRRPSLRIESVRLGEPSGIVVSDIWRQN